MALSSFTPATNRGDTNIMRYAAAIIPLFISALIIFAARQIAQPPATLRPKIFVIGLSKTGTSSIGDALALLQYKRLGWKDIRSRHLVHTWANGDYSALIDQTRYFDAFEDLPWPYMYRQMAEMYPDAKFLLSLRKDERTWLESMRRHVGRGSWQGYRYFYGATEVDGHEDVVLQSYTNHTNEVRAYFQDKPDRYGELVIDDGDKNWEVLCRMAECPEGRVPSIPFPKSNTAAHWQQGALIDNLHFMWSWSITRMEELSAESYYQGGWSVVNGLLDACSELYYKTMIAIAEPLEFKAVL
ncbi:hypothetical protein LTR56_012602 [Elasticomyces elasticus]|nr:hypothetical protein LTR22_018477 [Elasticomyces elasticus]KAK3639242.1 hypothetical protein LTR56_012602 [Elasticomyces elasticus]KAK4912546.1 hypothetical protein LTR49_019013 [Elasticomyces elasticus]KAK5751912.1 hypothetical protein LTS12_018018 [Elasticomyces elasticus]